MFRKWLLWRKLKIKYRIDYIKVVLVLTGENKKLDQACLSHLDDFVKRKYAESVIIFYPAECYKDGDIRVESGYKVKLCPLSRAVIDRLYSFYCFMKFFDNIVFTYVDEPSDNQLGRYLRETEVNEEDAACLALYHLRYVPEHDARI